MGNPAEELDFSSYLAEFNAMQKKEDEELFGANSSSPNGLGFPVSEAPATYEPTVLNARHREILRLHALGYKHVQIAAMLSITPVTVGYVVRSPLGKSFLAEVHEARTDSVKDVHNRLQEMSPFAAEILLDIMADGKTESNKLRAAEKVLEITGHKSENKHMHLHTHLSKDDIKQLKQGVKDEQDKVEEAEVLDAEEGDAKLE